jgi:hypothetical protein
MGRRPKPQQYQPSEVEKTQARIAQEDQAYFEGTYDPLLLKMRDDSLKQDTRGTLRGRAQADTMQSLTGRPLTLSTVSGVDTSANRALGAVGNMLNANVVAGDVKANQQIGVLATARGQAADAGSGLAKASKLARSEDLNRASASLSRATNLMGNVGRLGGSYLKEKGRQYRADNKLSAGVPE